MIALLLALQLDALEEIEGRLILEIESAAARGDWTLGTSLAGYSGRGYYTWTGPDLFGAPGKDALSWSFHVSRPGRYRLLLRNRHDFEDSTLQNDCFTKMDEGPWIKTFSSTRGEWTWHTRHERSAADKPDAVYELGPGLHVFQISGRSKGYSLDRVHLSLDASQDLAAPLSPTVLAAMGGQKPGSGPLSPPLLAFRERRAEAARALPLLERLQALQALAAIFKGDEGLKKEVDALRGDPALKTELKAEALLRRVEEAKLPAAQMAAACQKLIDAYPGTSAAKRAARYR